MSHDPLHCMQVEALGVNGLALARGDHAIGFRGMPLLPDSGRFDGKPVVHALTELGPHDPADHYHHVAFRVPVTRESVRRFLRLELLDANGYIIPAFADGEAATVRLEWTFDGARAWARFSSDVDLDFLVVLNGCVAPASVACLDGDRAVLDQDGWRVAMACRGQRIRALMAEATLDRLECRMRDIPLQASTDRPSVAGLLVRLGPADPFHIALAEESVDLPAVGDVDTALAVGRRDMEGRLMGSSGAAAGCADAIQRLVGFAAAYDPCHGTRFVPVNRDWAGPNVLPPVFLWDNFFDSYLACFHYPDLARDSLSHILGTLRDRGIAGSPPQRNLIVPIVFAKTVRMIGDDAFTAAGFPVMMEFLRFWFADRGDGLPWRDGNDDGLIECGSCQSPGDGNALGSIVQDAFDETGYDDSPMYSAGFSHRRQGLTADGVRFDFHRRTLNLTMVGQNALYVAACRAMAVPARTLGRPDDLAWLQGEAVRVSGLVRERLFDPDVGYYRNRFFDGTFSRVDTPDIFFPLLAGLADPTVAERLRSTLLDPARFWGEHVIPTVSRDDPAYRDDTRHGDYWRGNYWRGNIWAPTNYITYLAIREAGWSDVAAAFAAKSRRLFMDDWLPRHHACENYPPEGRTEQTQLFSGNGGRDPHYIWAALLPLLSLEALFSVEEFDDGVRFGSLEPTDFGAWRGFLYQGRRGRIDVGSQGVRLEIEGWGLIETDRPIAVRQFRIVGRTVSFRYGARDAVRMRVEVPGRQAALSLSTGMDREASFALQDRARCAAP